MTTTALVTIPSGKVASDQTAFIVRVDLADMPAYWWADNTGENLRVRDNGGTQLPFDVVTIDVSAKTGEVFVRTNVATASSTVLRMDLDVAATALPETDTYGRNAVWADYDFVCMYSDGLDRTGAGHDPAIVGTVASEFGPPVTQSSNDHWSQGVAWDATGSNWFSTATNEIRKYNSTFTGSITKSDPVGDAGLTASGANHVGDPVVVGTELFTVMETYPNSPYNNQWVAVFDVATLTFQRKYNISANAHECSSITHDGTYFYISDFTNPNYLHKYDSTFAHIATLTLPTPIDSMQGITWKTGFFYIMSGPHVGTSYIWKVADDMTSASKVYSGAAALEGVQLIGNDLYFCSPSGFDNLQKLPYQGTTGEAGWLTLAGSGHAIVTGLATRTAWTMAATVKWATVPAANRGIVSYSDNSSSDSNRASALGRSTGTFAMWNSSDGFTGGVGRAIVVGDVNVRRRVHYVQDTVTSRTLYVEGSTTGGAIDVGAAQRPAGTSPKALFIGAEDSSASERMNGKLSYIYLRNGVLSANWIAAEQASWEATGFYAVTAQWPAAGLVAGTSSGTGAGTVRALSAGTVAAASSGTGTGGIKAVAAGVVAAVADLAGAAMARLASSSLVAAISSVTGAGGAETGRAHAVAAAERLRTIPAETRTTTVKAESRVTTVPAENRRTVA